MKLSAEVAREIVRGYHHEDWQEVTKSITDHSRWSVYYTGVFLHIPSGKHYWLHWSIGATEQQYERPFEYDKEVEAVEVRQVEKVVTDWVPV